jgi:tetratricopeptide (TPR) repeat protein
MGVPRADRQPHGKVRASSLGYSVAFLLLVVFTGYCAYSAPAEIDQKADKTSQGKAKGSTELGLDAVSQKLINQGRFKDLIERLKGRTAQMKGHEREIGWLAFSYMFLNRCDELKSLAQQVSNAHLDDPDGTLVAAFNLICQKNLADGQKKLQSLPPSAMDDAFVNFAFAALAGKQGQPAVAVTYTQKAVDLAPHFAWGFRTIGFLKQRSLKAPAEAEVYYEKALQLEPDMSEATSSLIDLKLARKDYDGAIDVAQTTIKATPKDANAYFRLAQIYRQQYRLREAAVELNKAIHLQPADARFYRAQASILRSQGDLDEAIVSLKKAVDLSTEKDFELVALADMEAAAGRDDDATKHLMQAVSLNANNQQASDELVKILTRRGKTEQLATVLRGIVEKNPKNAALRLYFGDVLVAGGKPHEGIEQYKEAANLQQNDAEPHRRVAATLMEEKDFRQAAKEYTRALNINPNSVPDLVALGYCYAQTDDYLQAEAGFVTALALHQLTQAPDSMIPPTRLDIMRSLCTLLYREGRYADAASQFETVYAMAKSAPPVPANTQGPQMIIGSAITGTATMKNLPPGLIDAFMLNQAVALRDRSKSSFQALKDAFEKLPLEEKALQRLNYIDTLLKGDQFDEAITQLTQYEKESKKPVPQPGASLATDSNGKENPGASKDDPLILVCWSRVWRGKKEIAKAEEAARKAVEVSGRSGTPLSDTVLELGEVLLAKGDTDGAIKNANRALEINDKSFRAHELAGRASLRAGQVQVAMADAKKALETDPYYTEGNLLLGDAQMALGDYKSALASYQKAVELYPGLLQTHERLLAALKKLSMKDEAQKEEANITRLKGQQ